MAPGVEQPPGCPELCFASANQPPRPHQSWMAPPPCFPQALLSQLLLWSDAAVLRVPQGGGVTLTADARKPGEDRGLRWCNSRASLTQPSAEFSRHSDFVIALRGYYAHHHYLPPSPSGGGLSTPAPRPC